MVRLLRMVRKIVIGVGLAFVLAPGSATAACTPFGGDDSGCVPSTKGALKCERAISGATARLIKRVIKCHEKRAAGILADDAAEDTCESAAKTKYDNKVASHLANCASAASCVNASGVRDLAISILDQQNGVIYCASPSGAFPN